MGNILHLIPDEKITDDIISNFDEISDDNIFLILGDKKNKKYTQITKSNIIWVTELELKEYYIPDDLMGLVVHGLNSSFAEIILRIRPAIKIAWYVWGYDVYHLPKINDLLYAKLTLKYLKNQELRYFLNLRIKKNSFIRKLYFKLISKDVDTYDLYEKAHKRINYFCTYIIDDYKFFKKYYPNKINYLETGYFSINQYLNNINNLSYDKNRKSILIGNSNSIENNHLDIFYKLKNFNELFFEKALITPLNYGSNNNYKNVVIEEGVKLFGNSFYPLLEFMKKEEYIELLKTCSCAIFYHYRQQAMGNIFALLYLGCRIYLSNLNPAYNYLKRIGIIVFDFDNDFDRYKNSQLEDNFVLQNQKILKNLFSEDAIRLQTQRVIKHLRDEL